MIREALRFPPVALFTIILLLGVTVNTAAVFENREDSMQKMYFLNPSAVLPDEIKKPGRVSVMVMTNAEGDYSGWKALVYVYDPEGKLFDVREGLVDGSTAVVDIWFGKLATEGNYTILPGIGFDYNHIVIGKPAFIEITGGEGE